MIKHVYSKCVKSLPQPCHGLLFTPEQEEEKHLTPDEELGMSPREMLTLAVHVAVCSPEEGLCRMDGDDSGVLLVGVCGAELQTITRTVLKLHTHYH